MTTQIKSTGGAIQTAGAEACIPGAALLTTRESRGLWQVSMTMDIAIYVDPRGVDFASFEQLRVCEMYEFLRILYKHISSGYTSTFSQYMMG